MSRKKVPINPLIPVRKPGVVSRYVTPSSVGTATAVSLLLASHFNRLTVSRKLTALVPASVLLTVGGFTAGYTVSKLADSIRWQIVRRLFTYQDWMFNPKSWRTKLWAYTVYTLEGSSEKPTYFYQRMMPKQPLPDLDSTLDLWLEVTQWWLTPDEWECTKEAVESFRNNEGPTVQEYLRKKAKKEVNWVSNYWLYAAYLAGRDPLPIHSNYCGTNRHYVDVEQLPRASSHIFYYTKYNEYLAKGKVPPTLALNMVPMCMNSYHNLFGINRIPGEHIDSITRHKNTHIVVIRKGNYYKLDLYPKNPKGKKVKLTIHEIQMQLERILQAADNIGENPLQIADVTAQNRTVWAKLRLKMMERNEEALNCIEGALFVYHLPDYSPKEVNEMAKYMLVGGGGDRWFDKCFTGVTFANGWAGTNVEHSVIDAMVFGELMEYWFSSEKYDDGKLLSSPKENRTLPPPELIEWDLKELESDIIAASDFHKSKRDDIDMIALTPKLAKGDIKKLRVSPDGFVQMAMQLTYYRLHKEFPKSYEPATGRMYALGRTETVHPASEWSVKWVKAMEEGGSDRKVVKEYLKSAIKHQSNVRIRCTAGNGCDRHLLGLLCASRELGMDLPAIFMDKAWRMGFKLSTSQTPNRMHELHCPVMLSHVGGWFGPTDKDGYGISYIFAGDESLMFFITSFFSSPETSSAKFSNTLDKVFLDMRDLLQTA